MAMHRQSAAFLAAAAILVPPAYVVTPAFATDYPTPIVRNAVSFDLPAASDSRAATYPSLAVAANDARNSNDRSAAPAAARAGGLPCAGADDTAALNALVTSGAWSLPPKKTCLVSGPLDLSGSARLSGHQWSSAISPVKPLSSLIEIGGAASNRASVEGIYLQNVSSLATNGVHYHTGVGNNPVTVRDSRFFGLTNGVLADAAWPGGDALNVERSYFQNNGVAVNFANLGMASSVHGNYVLSGSGVSFGMASGGYHNEGTRVYDNTILPNTAPNSYAVSITAGLELSIFANIFDQVRHNHGVIVDATTNAVSAVKLVSNWIGPGAGRDPKLDGVHIAGPANYIPIVANTIGNWTSYGVNFAAGAQDAPIIGNKLYNNAGGDIRLHDTAGVALIANRFQSKPAWVESGITKTVAIGNRCDHPAVVSGASLVLGDGSCAPNRIPGVLTIRQSNTTQTDQLSLLNESAANSIAKTDGIGFAIKDTRNDIKNAARIHVIPHDPDVTAASMTFSTRHAGGGPNPRPDLTIDASGNVLIASALTLGSQDALTLTAGALGFAKIAASRTAPGAAGGKIELVCGTRPGTAKLQVYAGTSATPVTILDNIGAGVGGC